MDKYFGEIQAGVKPAPLPVQDVTFESTRRISYEDPFASAPQLRIMYPSVEMYDDDGYALDFLCMLLSSDRKSPMYKIIVEEKKLASGISMYNSQMELAGMVSVQATTFPDVKLDEVYNAVGEAYARFEENGIDDKDLERYKTIMETQTYNRLVSDLNKALYMAQDNTFTGDPDHTMKELTKYRKVSKADIMRVYDKYIKGKNYLGISIVPAGETGLALSSSVPAVLNTEGLDEQELKSQAGGIIDDPYEKTPSLFDRSIEPPLMANTPELKVPEIWNITLGNGITVKGISYTELPLVNFYIRLNDGMLRDSPAEPGVAYMTAQMMNEGTALKTPEELQEAKGQLGASISVSAGTESMTISGMCLKKNFKEVIALVEEILLQPRWDEKSFGIVKERNLDNLRQSATQPSYIGSSLFRKLIFGRDNIISNTTVGTEESVSAITMDDLKAFYNVNISPSVAKMGFVGGLNSREVERALTSLTRNWEAKDVVRPVITITPQKPEAKLYFVDYPGASQSYIIMGNRATPLNSPSAFTDDIINDKLGGSAGSILFDVLRLKHGYTYGAYSGFMQGNYANSFSAYSSVQAIATKESLALFRDILSGYKDDYSSEYLETTRNSMLRTMNGSFETPGALLGMLQTIDYYDMPEDYVKRRETTLKTITLEQAKDAIARNIVFDNMVIVVVGDAQSQLANVKSLGLGAVLLVDRNGDPVK